MLAIVTSRIARAAAVALCVVGVLPRAAASQAGDGFVSLFDGTLNGWVIENEGKFTVRDGLLRVEAPAGWLRSEREYGDFQVRLEFRFLTDDADSGLFIRAAVGPSFGRGWPNGSYQVQMRNPIGPSRFPPIGGLFRHGMPPGTVTFDPAQAAALSKPTGEWQLLEAAVVGERLTVRLNGTEITRAADLVPRRGFIGLQGETGALELRAIGIREQVGP